MINHSFCLLFSLTEVDEDIQALSASVQTLNNSVNDLVSEVVVIFSPGCTGVCFHTGANGKSFVRLILTAIVGFL